MLFSGGRTKLWWRVIFWWGMQVFVKCGRLPILRKTLLWYSASNDFYKQWLTMTIKFWRFKFYLWFSDDFREIRSLLIHLNSLNFKREIWQQSHMKLQKLLLGNCFPFPAGNYIIKVDIKNTRTRCEICSKVTIKTPEQLQ